MKAKPGLFRCLKTVLLALLLLQTFAQISGGQAVATFNNPAPVNNGGFSSSLAVLGTDRVVFGAVGAVSESVSAGAAYLFTTNGSLLTVFANPFPKPDAYFGSSLAVVGTSRVLIGSPTAYLDAMNNGAAYLFNTNGALMLTLTNPTPQSSDKFGYAVAAVGGDRLLVGAFADSTGATQAGAAYLFSTNGALLATFTNPTPAAFEYFGYSVAALGNNRVLIGAVSALNGGIRTGEAYLFSTNGTLLRTFTNPTPQVGDGFGGVVATMGTDQIIISDYLDDLGGVNTGAVYLFNTNGTLLTTFTKPNPVSYGFFGISVAAVGSNRVLIGSEQDVEAKLVGAAFLFSTNGALLNTFTNPAPAIGDDFGYRVAAVGSGQIIVGSPYDKVGGISAGSAYLFALPYPQLGIERNGNAVTLNWVTPETGLVLQQADSLGTPTPWSDSTDVVSVTGQTNFVQQAIGSTNRLFRLNRP
jgi:hypothetical protein